MKKQRGEVGERVGKRDEKKACQKWTRILISNDFKSRLAAFD
jgi:hypothetical protein